MRGSLRLPFLLRSIVLIGVAASSFALHAQSTFTINGRLKIDGGDINGAKLVVYRNGQKERTITSNLNKFSMDLDLNANYILSFEKEGFVSKKLSFNTNVPAEATATEFTPFDYAVSLFKQYDDLNMIVFNQPVGIIRYEPALGDFDYDTDYTKSIQSQLQQALDAVAQKQKEEAENATAEAKRKAAEEKENERLRQEAEKLAAAKAKADAEAAKQERKAEEKKIVEAPKKAEPKVQPKDPGPIAPVAVAAPKPVKKASAPKPVQQRSASDPVLAQMTEQSESRRSIGVSTDQSERPVIEVPVVWTDRKEELFVEPNKVMTVVQITTGEITTEYRKVIHKWGGTFYFKNGEACTQLIYEKEAYGESLAGATPRGKFD